MQETLDSNDRTVDAVMQSLPDEITTDVADEIFEEFSLSSTEALEKYRQYIDSPETPISEADRRFLSAKSDTLCEQLIERYRANRKIYDESAKGNAHRAYTEKVNAEKIARQKECCRELKIKTTIAAERVAQARKIFTKIIASTKDKQEEAIKLVSEKTNGKITMLSQNFMAVLKSVSPKTAYEYLSAKADEKDAYWNLYDQESAKRLSEAFYSMEMKKYSNLAALAEIQGC